MSIDLKPCPFCGDAPKYEGVSRYNLSPVVWCNTVGCALDGEVFGVDTWNNRAPVRVKLPPTIIADNDSEMGRLRRQFTGQPQTMEVLDKALVVAALKAQGVEAEQ